MFTYLLSLPIFIIAFPLWLFVKKKKNLFVPHFTIYILEKKRMNNND